MHENCKIYLDVYFQLKYTSVQNIYKTCFKILKIFPKLYKKLAKLLQKPFKNGIAYKKIAQKDNKISRRSVT